MRTKLAIASVCVAALAFAASSASATHAQSNPGSKEKQAESKKKCRWIETTGSNRSERICLTAEEWRKVDEYVAREF